MAHKNVSRRETHIGYFCQRRGKCQQMCLVANHSVSARFFPFNRPGGHPKMKTPVVWRRRARPCRDARMPWGALRRMPSCGTAPDLHGADCGKACTDHPCKIHGCPGSPARRAPPDRRTRQTAGGFPRPWRRRHSPVRPASARRRAQPPSLGYPLRDCADRSGHGRRRGRPPRPESAA